MDVVMKTPDGRFNYRVCAVIIHDGKLLAMKDHISPYYYLPGGRVKLHETAEHAMIREIEEELGVTARIDRALWLNQGFFVEDVTKDRFHEICLYFLVDITGTGLPTNVRTFEGVEKNKKHIFEWLTFEDVKKAYLYPIFIKSHIETLPEHLEIRQEFE